jgi:hypothetical protein
MAAFTSGLEENQRACGHETGTSCGVGGKSKRRYGASFQLPSPGRIVPASGVVTANIVNFKSPPRTWNASPAPGVFPQNPGPFPHCPGGFPGNPRIFPQIHRAFPRIPRAFPRCAARSPGIPAISPVVQAFPRKSHGFPPNSCAVPTEYQRLRLDPKRLLFRNLCSFRLLGQQNRKRQWGSLV